MSSLLLKGGTLVNGQKEDTADILISQGSIEQIGPSLSSSHAQEIDCTGMHIMPGMIDTHVHFREPGLTHKATISSESCAAVAGGVTTICDMPNTIPHTTTIHAVKEKQKLYSTQSLCHYGIYIGASKQNLDELKYADEDDSIPGIKIFMAESTGDMTLHEETYLDPIFSQTKKLIAIHAEDEHRRLMRKEQFEKHTLPEADDIKKDDPFQHALIRDNLTAAHGTKKAIDLALKHKRRAHILHVSTQEELPFLLRGKNAGYVTAETCPHYLFFTREDIRLYGGYRIMNPSLKGEKDTKALWKAIQDGIITQIATDHAPHLKEEKQLPYGKLPAGLPGIQYALPLLLHSVYNRLISLPDVVRLYAQNPARHYQIINKGFLKEGYDADLTIVHLNKTTYVSDSDVLSRCKWTPYHGMMLRGKIMKTIINGAVVYDDGVCIAEKQGRCIKTAAYLR